MATLDEWISALSVPRKVSIESLPTLLTAIQAKQTKRDALLKTKGKKLPTRKSQLALAVGLKPTQDIGLAPIHLLHRLGVVTTPPVPNLVDICSTWAYIRYLWAFALPKGSPGERLRLSQPAVDIDFHQKGLMSDQIGVGMAAVIMATYFDAPEASDVDVALGGPVWQFKLEESVSPDYLFSNADQSVVYVVECKGTRRARGAAIEQMRKGTEQVPSLQFTDGRPQPTALVIGTQLTKTGTNVLVIDPPGDGSDGPPPNSSEADAVTRTGPRAWRISNAAAFESATRNVSQAKLLAYGAEDQAAVAKMRLVQPEATIQEPARRESVFRENRFGAFEGSRDLIPFRDGIRLEVFQGLQRSLRAAYIADDVETVKNEASELRKAIATEATSGLRGFGFEREEKGKTIQLRSVAPDGTILELTLTKP